uniref:23S rRNA (Uracil(1939)-C(5))-methyltransferase RlmD n=1 Tax=candidate division CPR3 bacterium TaxID=2268181 RepID=A0A7C4R392_UNCC3
MIKLNIEKLVEGGQGFAQKENKTYFVWNVLPGEEVEVEILKHRKGIYECLATNVLKPSKHRVDPRENHFLSCSPWQIMDWDYENEMKLKIVEENYKRLGKLEIKEIEGTKTDDIQFGYRNKMEFSFVEEDGKISLALFRRGQKSKIALDHCELATDAINNTAKKILDWINTTDMTMRNLKTLIVRSNQKGETIAGLFIKDKLELDCRGLIHQTQVDDKILGFSLYYSTHKSPASVITDVLYQEGQDFLIEKIGDKKFKYGINSFFQVNIPVFEMALNDILKEAESPLIDMYSGVGVIGIISGTSELIESNTEAIDFALDNIRLNNLKNIKATLSPSEKALDYIKSDNTIIFDPPRAGLNQKIIDKILEEKPKKIIYLSCNTATHARDIGLIQGIYKIKSLKLYNFFPRTPHIESLAVLELKK